MTDRIRKNIWPLAIFLAAFLLRLVYLMQYRSNPAFEHPMVDELWHINWARDILGGDIIGHEAYFRGPLYPYFLAFLQAITGKSIFFTRLIQMIIGSLSAVLVYYAGRKLFNRNVGIIAGFAFAIYGTMIFYEAMFLIPVIYIPLTLLTFLYLLKAVEHNLPISWFLSGLFMGLAAIARPNILFLVPFIIIWLFFKFFKTAEIKSYFKSGIVYIAAILIPILCVSIRNIAVTGEFILISSQGGVNLYIGNNPHTDGLTMLMPEVAIDESLPWSEFTGATKAAAERITGKQLTPAEESSFWTGKAVDFIAEHPGKFLEITFKKLVYFLNGFENSDNADIYFSRQFSSLFSILLWREPVFFPFGFFLPLAVVGLVATWKNRKALIPLYIFMIGYIPTVILFLVTARHRLPVIPFVLIMAAAGIYQLYQLIKNRNWIKAGALGLIFVVVLMLVNRTYFEIGFQNESQIHFNLALAHERDNNLPEAEKEYKLALRTNPASPTILNNLGYVQYLQHKHAEALNNFGLASKSDPQFAQAYHNTALVYEAEGNYSEAQQLYRQALNVDPSMYQTYINLGDLYIRMKDYQNAEAVLRQAVDMNPKSGRAYFKLGSLYGRMGDFTKAEEYFNKGQGWGSPTAGDYVNWANIYYATSRPEQALDLYHKATAAAPDFAQVYFNMAITFQRYGYPADSTLYYLRKTVEVEPNHAQARQLLQEYPGN